MEDDKHGDDKGGEQEPALCEGRLGNLLGFLVRLVEARTTVDDETQGQVSLCLCVCAMQS